MSTPQIWLITGASSGFGRALAEAAIAAGDTVVAVARRTAALDDLVTAHPDQLETVALDVTDTARIDAVVADVVARHGRIDVLVNNAGRTQVGAVEETTETELRDLFDLHVFGPAALTRAVLPHMRAQRGGAVVMMSSVGGQLSFAGFSAYSATKFALEGLSEALADEVAPFGIKVLIVEPGAFRTGLFGRGAATFSAENAVYADTSGKTRRMVEGGDGTQPGDPAKAAAAIRAALAAEKSPLRLPLGEDAVDAVLGHLDAVRTDVLAWESVTRATDFD
ncbi:short-chain dehydrogenase/reductase [Nocardia neocaledoniensis NBRC 108232]|uniref:Short-subunit dehydrogenase n=1 Tax=Nocardia neocaledoniensis TaxID=236511 RepID=A0A317N5X1_9NOCA|nr:oxidoreductase [Nocardia neocaledoniensis]PWV70686.1 short-subunit dehydrogenase [Nocardia neocaledoniensis]GEM32342.1 short-chain dehydrogenase/reductase [Nocardia neocaledoniensis NBRC 108232]